MISGDIHKAAELLRQEAVIGLPTETVYGLAGNIFSEKAIRTIYETKQRPYYNPLIVHIGSMADLDKVAKNIPSMARDLARRFWPGPLTLLLEKTDAVPSLVTAGKETVAVRMPDHPVALALLNTIDFPLAAPSANPFGAISPTTAKHVEHYFHNKIPMVLEGGPCRKGVESTIIGFRGDSAILYRYGAIPQEEIELITGPLTLHNKEESTPDAPGMLSKHYSPRTPTVLTTDVPGTIRYYEGKKAGLLLFSNKMEGYNDGPQLILSDKGDLGEAAAHLYEYLHRLDEKKPDLIICEKMKEEGLGRTINDRLLRASVESIL